MTAPTVMALNLRGGDKNGSQPRNPAQDHPYQHSGHTYHSRPCIWCRAATTTPVTRRAQAKALPHRQVQGMEVPVRNADRPFVWYPLAGQRHAIDRDDRNARLGEPMRCLCGVSHPRGADGDSERLWPTCQQCWDETCAIVGLNPPQ